LVVIIMFEDLEFLHMKAFVAVVEECSFVRAAARLKITQPALSHQIKKLETGCGLRLLVRGQTGTSITDYGRDFLLLSREMLRLRDHAIRTTTVDKSGAGVPLRFGYSPFTDYRFVEEARIGYVDMVPRGSIRTYSECSAELMKMVADGRLDAALVSLPLTEKNLYVRRICTEKLLVCLRRDDPMAQGAFIPQSALESRLALLSD
jgi:DNA-binding transcriptional LysR family regulator